MPCEEDELDVSVTGTSGTESKNRHDRTAEDWFGEQANPSYCCY